uniref:Uncharacterized protein n=1 Tax=Oryza meridionalis TaxID=40149 RepID=A0A0E0F7T8_9ORYZ
MLLDNFTPSERLSIWGDLRVALSRGRHRGRTLAPAASSLPLPPLTAAGARRRSPARPAVRAAARPFPGDATTQREDDNAARDGWAMATATARREASDPAVPPPDLAPPWPDPAPCR